MAQGVPLYGADHHEYIEIDSGTFLSPTVLDVSNTVAHMVNQTVKKHMPSAQVWGGEIGPHNGGSPPCDHTSMRWSNFGDSFWYADALATKAKNGYSAMCRQDYIGADYGMTDCSTGAPLPDFYTGIVYSSVMGTTVLATEVVTPDASAVRAYAHCYAKGGGNGSAAVLLMNLHPTDYAQVALPPPFSQGARQNYLLQASADGSIINATGLLGTGIKLNGNLLTVGTDGSIAPLKGDWSAATDPTNIPPMSILFSVFTDAALPACSH